MVNYKFEQKAKVAVTEELDQALLETLQSNRWSAPMIVIDTPASARSFTIKLSRNRRWS